jgi:capsular polysaccharide biosynthesis protein
MPDRDDPIRGVRRRTAIVAMGSIVGGVVISALAAIWVLNQPPLYESVAAIFFDQPRAIALSEAGGEVDKLNDLRRTYAALLQSWTFTTPVAAQLQISRGDVQDALHAIVPGKTMALAIRARSSSATNSQRIAEGVADELIRFVTSRQDRERISASDRIRLIHAETAKPGIRIEPTSKRAALVGATAGAVGLMSVGLLLSRFSRSARVN